MTRRRRRVNVQDSSLFAFIILNLLIFSKTVTSSSHHHALNHQQQEYRHSSQQTVPLLAPNTQTGAHLCSMIPHDVSKHLKLCKLIRHSANANEAVALGASKGLAECRAQFKSERWNCTHLHGGDHHLLTSELAQSIGNRESGFVQAIAAAGIVHAIATACSVGSLSDCACDKSRIGLIRGQDENWKWGGCSNNIRHGMLFAKHLVELLDAVHQHQHQHQHLSLNSHLHKRDKRSLSSRNREPNQLRGRQSPEQAQVVGGGGGAGFVSALDQLNNIEMQQQSFCKKNHNISQATHMQLIKSLLAQNSLQKHQEIRLAMNMHNNKIGRMAVAKNMEFRCRCHGLSGSCSMKTCWLTLPNFQVIGAYLKKKYDSSVHLPSAVNLNKLIPLMDRNEISAILNSKQDLTPDNNNNSTKLTSTIESPQPESAPLIGPQPSRLSAHFIITPSTATAQVNHSVNAMDTPHHYYNKLLQQNQRQSNELNTNLNDIEIPVNLSPFSQQQYQALIKEMKLCNNGSNLLTTRDSNSQQVNEQMMKHHQHHNQQHQKSTPLAQQHQHFKNQLPNYGQQLKQANQQLSQLLHSNKEELIHLHKSPDYCEPDKRHGFGGIQARVCSDNPLAPDNCDKLCCGRGSTTRIYQHSFKCDCKFQYCCSIWCSVCEKEIKLQVCN